MKPPSWRNTFDTANKCWPSRAAAWEAATEAGYPYVAWNGDVYRTAADSAAFQHVVCSTNDMSEPEAAYSPAAWTQYVNVVLAVQPLTQSGRPHPLPAQELLEMVRAAVTEQLLAGDEAGYDCDLANLMQFSLVRVEDATLAMRREGLMTPRSDVFDKRSKAHPTDAPTVRIEVVVALPEFLGVPQPRATMVEELRSRVDEAVSGMVIDAFHYRVLAVRVLSED